MSERSIFQDYLTLTTPTDLEQFKGINPYASFCGDFKKCCKKYKKGKRCKNCPGR